MRMLIAIAASILSGFLLTQIVQATLLGLFQVALTSRPLYWSLIAESSCLSIYFLLNRAPSAWQVLRRGFLLGLFEWGALVLIGLLLFKSHPWPSAILMGLCFIGFVLTRQGERKSQQAELKTDPPAT